MATTVDNSGPARDPVTGRYVDIDDPEVDFLRLHLQAEGLLPKPEPTPEADPEPPTDRPPRAPAIAHGVIGSPLDGDWLRAAMHRGY